MGGNALKNVETRRIDRLEYDDIEFFVTSKLREALNNINPSLQGSKRRVDSILFYRTKETFGDLDILVETFPGDGINYRDLITRTFAPKELVNNSGVYSFDYLDFQIDLILTPTEDYVPSYWYLAWNDLGNLAGRIFKKLGFKYGHKGLSYMFRRSDQAHSVFADCVVSRDHKAIFEFGDLDYDRFMKGFDTLEEMFRWVSSSKYFHRDIYLLHNRNHVSRTRDKKRPVYNLFLKWCETTPNLPEYPWTEMREQDGYAGKPEFLRMAMKHFDGFAEEHSRIEFIRLQTDRAKERFNGEVVKEITGLERAELGRYIQEFIERHGGRSKLYPILAHATNEQVREMIKVDFESNRTVYDDYAFMQDVLTEGVVVEPLRKVEVLSVGVWIETKLWKLKKGDIFRMFEPDEQGVFNRLVVDGAANASIWIAIENPVGVGASCSVQCDPISDWEGMTT